METAFRPNIVACCSCWPTAEQGDSARRASAARSVRRSITPTRRAATVIAPGIRRSVGAAAPVCSPSGSSNKSGTCRPECRTANNGEWCVQQTKKLLPCEYFFVTFTIPAELRSFVRTRQELCYRAMFDAAALALKTALVNPKLCGADAIGFTSVLYTFGRDLNYHPHVHVIVQGGGMSDDSGRPAASSGSSGSSTQTGKRRPGGGMRDGAWKSTLPGFQTPVKLLSKLFRMEFERRLRQQLMDVELPAAREFRREFVSDAEAVGDGVATLKYLSRYVFRTAITNDRIVSLHNGQVTFRYRKSGEQRDRLMTLPVFEVPASFPAALAPAASAEDSALRLPQPPVKHRPRRRARSNPEFAAGRRAGPGTRRLARADTASDRKCRVG
jgi:hypothetical protein